MIISVDKIERVHIKSDLGVAYIGQLPPEYVLQADQEISYIGNIYSSLGDRMPASIRFPRKNSENHPQMVNLAIQYDEFKGGSIPNQMVEVKIEILGGSDVDR